MNEEYELILSFVAATLLLVLLVGFIISFAFLFQRRQFQYRREKQTLQETFDRTLLQSQLETQNQTLAYIGQELHDNLGQMLSVAMLQLNGLEDELTEPAQQATLHRMVSTIEGAIQALRQLAKTLDSGTVQRFGLTDSLALELERIEQTGRYQTQLQRTGQPYALGEKADIILFRMAQESLNNALKHARACALTITVDYQPEQVVLTIADDGRGFVMAGATTRGPAQAGSGLGNLQQRAGLLGGSCRIESQLGAGTQVCIEIPRLPFEK